MKKMESSLASSVPNMTNLVGGGGCGGQTPIPPAAVGFILLNNGSLFSFGLLPPSVEARAAPGPEEWNEIKICPPSHVLALPATKLAKCPADYCNDKIKSHEAHAKKHLSLILEEQCKNSRLNNTAAGNCLVAIIPPSLQIRYYCSQSLCYSGLQMLDQSRGFSRMKYLRQHYLKLHAPKTFACSICSKSFSTLGLLGGHMKSCGNSFECSTCQKQYNSLEALQTHCRRNDHSTDYSIYKDKIDNAKNEISALRKAEKDLKQRLVLDIKQPEPLPVQVIIPRPKTITCGPGGNPSHVIWTYDRGVDTPKVKAETCTQTDTGIITTPEATYSSIQNNNNNSNNSNSNNTASRLEGRKRSAETQTGKIEKYKVSQEAQTLNVTKRRRTSKKQIAEAETQCSVPRHPTTTSRSDSDEISTPENSKSDSTSTATTMFFPPVVPGNLRLGGHSVAVDTSRSSSSSGGISLQVLMSMVGIDGGDHHHQEQQQISSSSSSQAVVERVLSSSNNAETNDAANETLTSISTPPPSNNVVNVLDQQFESGVDGYKTKTSGVVVSTSEVCVGFDESLDLINLDDFLRFELTRETQTDALFPYSEFNDDQLSEPCFSSSSLNNLVTAETQTSFVISESGPHDDPFSSSSSDLPLDTLSVNLLAPSSSTSDWNNLNLSSGQEDYPMNCDEDNTNITMLSSNDGGNNRNNSSSPSYLETIDGETQTTFPDDFSDEQLMMDCLLPSIFHPGSGSLNPDGGSDMI